MSKSRVWLLAVGLGVVLAGSISAQERRQRPGQQPPGGGFGQRFGAAGPLLSADDMEKLKLSSDQKGKVEKIVADFDEKAKAVAEKVREAMQKARENMDRDAFAQIREITQEAQKAREDATGKITALLTDEQKKTFEELQQQRRRRGPGGGPGGQPFGRFGGTPGQILPPALQQRLELTNDQKEQVEKLQKEVTEKLNKILNEEQRKRLEEMRTPRGGGRPRVDLD